MDSRNGTKAFDSIEAAHAYEEGFYQGWDSGVGHVEYPLTEIWKRYQAVPMHPTSEAGAFRDLIDDIGDLLDFLGK